MGISYDADLEKATKLMLEAAADTRRILQDPKPACLVTGFGDNGLNLELRVWINDPQNGLGSVKNELLGGVLRRFKEEGIELPYSQMVLHHKSVPMSGIGLNPGSGKADDTAMKLNAMSGISIDRDEKATMSLPRGKL